MLPHSGLAGNCDAAFDGMKGDRADHGFRYLFLREVLRFVLRAVFLAADFVFAFALFAMLPS